MEKVLFDFTIYQYATKFHGGGEYGHAVLNALLKYSDKVEMGIFFIIGNKVDMSLLRKCEEKNIKIFPCNHGRNVLAIIRKYGYRTVYSALPSGAFWRGVELPETVRFIYTLHGIRLVETAGGDSFKSLYEDEYVTMEESYQRHLEENKLLPDIIEDGKNYYRDIMKGFLNKIIVTDSEHSRCSIMLNFPEIPLEKIIKLYAPVKNALVINDSIFETEYLMSLDVQKRNFGLIVSAGIWYKNGLRGALAYDMVIERCGNIIPEDFKIVILGVKNKESFSSRIKNKERFIIKDYVEESELEVLYKYAQLLLYPSLNEGFGYPPLEAMKYGTLCACSVNTSISEICRDMVWYFNPLSIDEMANRIVQSFDKELRETMKDRILNLYPQIVKKQEEDLEQLVQIILEEK